MTDTNPFADKLQIIDCRPRVNAELNHAKGKGYEHPAQYHIRKVDHRRKVGHEQWHGHG